MPHGPVMPMRMGGKGTVLYCTTLYPHPVLCVPVVLPIIALSCCCYTSTGLCCRSQITEPRRNINAR